MGIIGEAAVEGFVREMCKDLKQRIEKEGSSPRAVSALKEFGIHIIKSSSGFRPEVPDGRYDEWAQEYLKFFRG